MAARNGWWTGIVAVFTLVFVFVVTSYLTNRAPLPHHTLLTEGGRFEFVLMRQMAAETPDRNLCISPLSAQTALYMVYNGAGGETRKSLAKVLGVKDTDPDKVNKSRCALIDDLSRSGEQVRLRSSNSVWVDRSLPLKHSFTQACQDFYSAEVYEVSFGSLKTRSMMDEWIKKNTRGQIKGPFPPIRPDTGVVLVNTLDFSGLWTWPFDKKNTRSGSFTLSNGKTVSVPMMEHFVVCRNYKDDDFVAVALPYLDRSEDMGVGRYAMYIFLPEKRVGLDGFLDMLNEKNWHKWMAGFEKGAVELSLPRFTVHSEESDAMKSALVAMGLETLFRPGADFSQMCEYPIRIDQVIQMTRVSVDEKGTEAAASTEVRFPVSGTDLKMAVDRPFFFAIRDDKTGTLLFMGLVYDPTGQAWGARRADPRK